MLTVALPPDVELRLQGEASRQGIPAEEYVKKLIVDHLPPAENGQSLAALFSQWEAEDGTVDPAEIERPNREVDEFKQAMNRNRLDSEGEGARKLFP
jgi:hypothetical protein